MRSRVIRADAIIACVAALGALGLAACASDNGDEPTKKSTQAAAADKEQHAMGTGSSGGPGRSVSATAGPSASGISFDMADGSPASMADYKGRVVLVVNVASECGLTPQVASLQELQQAYAGKPFTVLAFPSASFDQEPLGSAEAAEFCQDMGATYPVAAKVDVKGASAHPLFVALAERGGEPNWNFTKYLVGPDGTVIARFDPRTSPTADEVRSAIDAALAG